MTTSGDKLIERLRELAEGFKGELWDVAKGWVVIPGTSHAAYIAAANPQAILALLTALAEAEERAVKAEGVAQVRLRAQEAACERHAVTLAAFYAAESEAASWKALAGKAGEALAPFAALDLKAECSDDQPVFDFCPEADRAHPVVRWTVGDFRRARAALSLLPEVEGGG